MATGKEDAQPGEASPWLGVAEIRAALEARWTSALELTDATLARIQRLEPRLHAYAALWPERARARAEALDALPAERRGPLHGVPVALKDLCDVRGEPTRAGTVVLGERPAASDAAVVRRLLEAGAVLLGRAQMTEGAFTAHHPSVEPPTNPWNAARWTGISSSGSGVAVAAGLCALALGTDTGGSIRFPSAACGAVGLKPTHGRVPLAGIFPLAPSLDHVGPMARSVADAAAAFAVLAGPDAGDPSSRAGGVTPRTPVSALRVGFDPAYAEEGVDPVVAAGVRAVLRALEAVGVRRAAVEMPPSDEALASWMPICAAEAALAHAESFPARREAYGPSLTGLLERGLSLDGRDVARAWQQRTAYTRRLERVFESCDVLVCPALATRFAAGTDLAALPPPDGAVAAMRFTLPFDLSGSPSLTLPCGLDDEGAPIAVQLVGAPFAEERLLALGALLEERGITAIGRPDLGAG